MDKCNGGIVRTGFTMQQSNNTHHLFCPKRLSWQMKLKVTDKIYSTDIL